MGLKDDVSAFFDAVDLVSVRLRGYMRSAVAAGVGLQGLIAAGVVHVTPGSKWDRLAGILTAVVAYFTVRNADGAKASIERRKTGTALAVIPSEDPPG